MTQKSAAAPLLELEGVEKVHRSGGEAFRLLVPELRIAAGERIVLLGPSGSGKSTLLDLLALLSPPDAAVRFTLNAHGRAHDVAAAWRRSANLPAALRARHIGYVLQTGGLVPYLSVGENIILSRRLLGLAVPGPLATLAEAVGIGDLLDRLPAEISVGQRQRAALARALAHRPALLLADEPTAALDPQSADRVLKVLLAASEALGAAMVLVTHDTAIARASGGRVIHCRPAPGSETAISMVSER